MEVAFVITDKYNDNSIIIFNTHRVVAHREGANYLGYEFNDVTCKRESKYDKFYPSVPISQLLKDGWWYTCSNCNSQVFEENVVKIDEENNRIYCEDCNAN